MGGLPWLLTPGSLVRVDPTMSHLYSTSKLVLPAESGLLCTLGVNLGRILLGQRVALGHPRPRCQAPSSASLAGVQIMLQSRHDEVSTHFFLAPGPLGEEKPKACLSKYQTGCEHARQGLHTDTSLGDPQWPCLGLLGLSTKARILNMATLCSLSVSVSGADGVGGHGGNTAGEPQLEALQA